MPDNELHVPERILSLWNDVYSDDIVRVHVSIR
jgi:hypothetical protein